MLKRLGKSEGGFTLVETMATLVLLVLALGSVSQAFSGGVKLIGKQSDQMDLRMSSRQVMTRMEKDIQAAASVNLVYKASGQQQIQLIDKDGTNYETYNYNTSKKDVEEVKNGVSAILARDVTSLSFLRESGETVPAADTTYTGVPKVFLQLNMARSQESLNIQTNISPRWNAGVGVPAIISVSPNVETFGQTTYQFTIQGVNTHWNSDSIVSLRDGGNVYAVSSGPVTVTTSVDGKTQTITGVSVVTTDGNKLPFGFYDLYVETSLAGGGTETVYAYSVITLQWAASQWVPSTGTYNNGGFDASHFPYVKKDANNNDKVDYFKAVTISDFQVKVGIDNYYSKGMNTSYFNKPDSEIALWAVKDPGGTKFNTYLGFGINKDSVFLRQMNSGSQTRIVKIPNLKIDSDPAALHSWAVLEATASGGTIDFWVNGQNVDSLIDQVDSTIRFQSGSGYLGVVVPNNYVVGNFTIVRM